MTSLTDYIGGMDVQSVAYMGSATGFEGFETGMIYKVIAKLGHTPFLFKKRS
jgi:hypothetical protein